MDKLDPAVKRETLYVAGLSLVFSVGMELVFWLLGRWNPTVLFGNLVGYVASVFNFLAMGLTLQNALRRQEEKKIKELVKLSHTLRLLLLLAVGVVACMLPWLDSIATLVTFLFPRIAVTVRGLTVGHAPEKGGEQ